MHRGQSPCGVPHGSAFSGVKIGLRQRGPRCGLIAETSARRRFCSEPRPAGCGMIAPRENSDMARGQPHNEHLLRRAGFGATAEDYVLFDSMSSSQAVDYLVEFERQPDDVEEKIGQTP